MEQKFTPAPGDEVYSKDGLTGTFVGRIDGRNFVLPQYADEEYPSEPSHGDIEEWPAVFKNPPTNVLDAETDKAMKKLVEITAQIGAKRIELSDLDREMRARADRIKQHEGLAELDRYLAGEVTHYLTVSRHRTFDVEIIPVGDTCDAYGHSDASEYGVLKLCPIRSQQSPTGLRWSVYWKVPSPAYSRTEHVVLCCGIEEAQAKAKSIIQQRIDEAIKSQHGVGGSIANEIISACKKHGMEPPQAVVDVVTEARREAIRKELAAKEAEAQKAEALRQELAALNTTKETP